MKSSLLKFHQAAQLAERELPVKHFLEPESLFLLPLPNRVSACCEIEDEDIMEEEYKVITVSDDQQCFEIHPDWRVPGTKARAYDRIIKLTYGHFICRKGSRYTFYAVCRNTIGHEILQPTLRFTFEGDLTLELFLQSLSEAYPRLHDNLSSYLFRIPDQESYISFYRMFARWLIGSDIFLPLAFQRVILDNHFNIIKLYDVVDYYSDTAHE